MIRIDRIYDTKPVVRGKECRILVDSVWPKGLSKTDAALDVWMKEIAPSETLRTWFNDDAEKWDEFRARYIGELLGKGELVHDLVQICGGRDVVLLYGDGDREHNSAAALKEYVDNKFAADGEK